MSRLILTTLAVALLAGCANVKLSQPQAAIDNVVAVRALEASGIAAGRFSLVAGAKPAIDKRVTVRGSPIAVEGDGTFSGYLKETLIGDLKAAGKYDAAAPVVVEGELTDNTLNAAGIQTADALMAVRFKVLKAGQAVYDRRIEQRAEWKSSFVGAVAIPDAINRYSEQFRLILLRLYRDPDFQLAVK